MKLISVDLSAVHCTLKDVSYEAVYAMLRQSLPACGVHFAERKVGVKTRLVWQVEGEDWMPLSSAPAELRQGLMDRIGTLRPQIVSLLAGYPYPEAQADHILATPHEDFLFFRYASDGSAEVALAGWGYKSSLRPGFASGWNILAARSAMQNVIVGFTRGGQPLAGCEFRVGDGRHPLVTGPDGRSGLRELPIGSVLRLRCGDSDFTLEVQRDKNEYWFELPQVEEKPGDEILPPPPPPPPAAPARLLVVGADGQFRAGYSLTLAWRGTSCPLVSDAAGAVQLPAELEEGEQFVVADGQNPAHAFSYVHQAAQRDYYFQLAAPDLLFTVVEADGRPLAGVEVTCSQSGRSDARFVTDAGGRFSLPAGTFGCEYPLLCTVVAAGRTLEPASVTLDLAETDYVLEVETLAAAGNPRRAMWLAGVLGVLAALCCYALVCIAGGYVR